MTEWPDMRSAYDVVAQEYAAAFDDELRRKPFDRELLGRFADEVGSGAVWDVGCGPGHVGAHLAMRGVKVTGLDLSGSSLVNAQRLHPTLSFVQADMRSLPVRDETLGGIVAFYSLIHLPRGSVPAALAGMRRALRADGPLLIAVHVGEGENRATDWFGHHVSVAATLFQRDELTGFVEAAGLGVTEVRQRPPYDFEHQTHRLYVSAKRA